MIMMIQFTVLNRYMLFAVCDHHDAIGDLHRMLYCYRRCYFNLLKHIFPSECLTVYTQYVETIQYNLLAYMLYSIT